MSMEGPTSSPETSEKGYKKGWELLSNIGNLNDVYNTEAADDQEWIDRLKKEYGEENILVAEAYDIHGKLLRDMEGVYLKEGARKDKE